MRRAAYGVSLCLWAVFGLALWIPSLLVVMAIFVAGTVYSALTGEPQERLNRVLDRTTAIYQNGFRIIRAASAGTNTASSGGGLRSELAVAVIALAVVFWLFVLGTLGIVPGPLWLWLFGWGIVLLGMSAIAGGAIVSAEKP